MKPILAAIDLSDASNPVIEQAAVLARALDRELVLLHVAAPDPDFVGFDSGPQSVRDQLAEHFHEEHRRLQELEKQVCGHVPVCRSLLIQGSTAEKILEEIRRLDAGWVVIGSHGHGALHNLLIGSTAQGILRHSPIPVTVVPCRS